MASQCVIDRHIERISSSRGFSSLIASRKFASSSRKNQRKRVPSPKPTWKKADDSVDWSFMDCKVRRMGFAPNGESGV